jgi:two-component system, OmpR family, phosphate regulon sensor histidine kinase PhoR
MLKKRRLFWLTVPFQILLVLVLLALVTIDGTRLLRRRALDSLTQSLEADARLAAGLAAEKLASGDRRSLDGLCKTYGRAKSERLTIVAADGSVIGDSEADPAAMENHGNRPEVKEALAGREGVSRRFSMTLDRGMMYVAVPIASGGRIAAAARVSRSLTELEASIRSVHFRLGILPCAAGLLIAGLFTFYGWKIRQSIVLVGEGVRRLGNGEFGHRMYFVPAPVLDPVTDRFNEAAEALGSRFASVTADRDGLQSVMENMSEGVLLLDSDDRIERFNPATRRLLCLPDGDLIGRPAYELLRNGALLRLIERIRAASDRRKADRPMPDRTDEAAAESEIVFGEGGLRLRAHGAALKTDPSAAGRVLLVFSDVTRLRRLEMIRRDFVANVSHELKTPITAIQGFVETLRENTAADPAERSRFLDVIHRHAERLNSVVDDLLDLSRLERDEEAGRIVLTAGPLAAVLEEAAALNRPKAGEAGVSIRVDSAYAPAVPMNAGLLTQAVSNLIDNAVKYSERGGMVDVRCRAEESSIRIEVEDRGCGIPAVHLPRLFERFYRVDPSRSRSLGGTGLGLSIVRHIALAHGGTAEVRSEEGKGSVFSIVLPSAGP